MDETKVYFVRHAESTQNDHSAIVIDARLSKRGRAQARSLEGFFDLVICSPLSRTQETLALSNIDYCERMIEPLCRERVSDLPSLLFFEEDEMETDEHFIKRVNRFKEVLNKLRQSGRYQSILIVSHYLFYQELSASHESIDNAVIIKLDY